MNGYDELLFGDEALALLARVKVMLDFNFKGELPATVKTEYAVCQAHCLSGWVHAGREERMEALIEVNINE